ncbi:hypothetical protein ACOMHN_042278 [Nucella lapillus]
MGTTTGNSGTPLRRSLVWSNHTSYPGAAGVHSETGKKADAIQVGRERELDSSVSSLQALHQKDLKTLSQHRSLETSMLAYTEKMRRISSDRLQMAGLSRTSREEGVDGGGSSTLDRLLVSSTGPVSTTPGTRTRMSVDSGVDMTHSENEVRKTSTNRGMVTVSGSSPNKSRPISLDDAHSTLNPPMDFSRNPHQPSPSNAPRSRRVGTMEQPDVFSLKLSMQRKDRTEEQPSVDDQQSSPSSPHHPVPPLEIMPFPEPETSLRMGGAQADMWSMISEDFDRSSRTSSRTSQSSTKKLMKSRDSYWSYRKSPHRLSLPLPQAAKKKQSPPSEPLTPSPRPRPMNKRRVTPRRSNKTYHKTFRYSLAVDDVLHSLEEGESSGVSRRMRSVSDSLPSLDLHELTVERRQRLSQGRAPGTPTPTPALSLSARQDFHTGEDENKDDIHRHYPGDEDENDEDRNNRHSAVDEDENDDDRRHRHYTDDIDEGDNAGNDTPGAVMDGRSADEGWQRVWEGHGEGGGGREGW